ncbi:MAG: hypothetical protein J6I41_03155 [Bacteroidales bacterium]|nr:hypothetical protein [Bacteroidales bacterium]
MQLRVRQGLSPGCKDKQKIVSGKKKNAGLSVSDSLAVLVRLRCGRVLSRGVEEKYFAILPDFRNFAHENTGMPYSGNSLFFRLVERTTPHGFIKKNKGT